MKIKMLRGTLINGVRLRSMAKPENGGWRKVKIIKWPSRLIIDGDDITILSGTACIAFGRTEERR